MLIDPFFHGVLRGRATSYAGAAHCDHVAAPIYVFPFSVPGGFAICGDRWHAFLRETDARSNVRRGQNREEEPVIGPCLAISSPCKKLDDL